MAGVILRNVSKTFGDVTISKDINLDINDGEFVVFVGPSGCGKSTLLRMIAGLEDITAGDLLIGEQRMNDVPPAERGVGMADRSAQRAAFMTAWANKYGLNGVNENGQAAEQVFEKWASKQPQPNFRKGTPGITVTRISD